MSRSVPAGTFIVTDPPNEFRIRRGRRFGGAGAAILHAVSTSRARAAQERGAASCVRLSDGDFSSTIGGCARVGTPVAQLYDARCVSLCRDELQSRCHHFVKNPGTSWPEVWVHGKPHLVD